MELMRRARQRADDGFTLVEVVVAMAILLVVFLSAGGLLTATLVNSQRSRQSQTATELANQAIERLRALPYATIVSGSIKPVTTDPAVVLYNGIYYYGNQPLVWNNTSTAANQTPLDTWPWPQVKSNGTTFTVKTFVTCHHNAFSGNGKEPACSDTSLGPNDQILYTATVIVSWIQSQSKSPKQVVTQTVIFSPNGCQSTLTHPIAAPCEPFFYASADTGPGSISITAADSTAPAIADIPAFSAATLALPRLTANLQSEQTANVSAAGNAPSLTWTLSGTDSSLGATHVAAQASNDAGASGTPNDSENLTQAAVSQVISSTDGSTTLTVSEGSVGASLFAAAQSISGSACSDTTGQQLVTTLPCSTGQMGVGSAQAVLKLPSVGQANLVVLNPPAITNPLAVYTGRFGTTLGNSPDVHCASAALPGPGCVAAEAIRTPGNLSVGGLPSNVAANAPAGWNGYLISVNGYSDSAWSERGKNGAAPKAAVTAGTLSYWNGQGYTNVNLATATKGTSIPVSLVLTDNSSNRQVSLSGTIVIGGASMSTVPASGDQSDTSCTSSSQCQAVASVSSFTLDLVYKVTNLVDQTVRANLDIKIDLGQLLASSSYQAAGNGS
ncbi:MAG: prepilin-type N-terminal cleavage/methylation domain-containing protein [Acidothermus sp.]|nr:prepilin-type N-terminal cleavage/methylation domain-containing protein [Acidothermus sp.]